MIYSIIERLDRIEQKLDGKLSNRFLDIKQVVALTSLSQSTIRRSIVKGELKCSKKLGKLLFQEADIRKWLNGWLQPLVQSFCSVLIMPAEKAQEKSRVECYNYLISRVNQEIDEMPVFPTDETTKNILKLERLRETIVDQRDAWIFNNKES